MPRSLRTLALPLLTLGLVVAPTATGAVEPDGASAGPSLSWQQRTLDADQNFRGLDGVDAETAWVSGESRTDGGSAKVFRTTDGGEHWADVSPPDTENLSFRDVEARSASTALVLAIGEGTDSRIYRTDNGGVTWHEVFRNHVAAAFFNCMAFYPNGRIGLAVSDPVRGKFRIIRTTDAGRHWSALASVGMPNSAGEANFSASGDCLTIKGRYAWFGSGGERARVFRSADLGRTWRASDSRITPGEAAGVFALAFRGTRHGIVVGGDFADPGDGVDAAASTTDGRAWSGGGDLRHLGEDVAWRGEQAIVVGEYGGAAGSSITADGGRSWRRFSPVGFHTLDCTLGGACWAAGGDGRVGVLRG